MADVSQLEINGTTYDICDATARDSASQRLPLSGGTLTGSLRVQSIDIDRNGADPSAYVAGISMAFSDKDGDNIGIIRPGRNASGREDLQISVRNENNDTQVENNLTLQVAKDGTCSYYVSDGLAFCNAIGALPLSGGTVTGSLDVEGSLRFSYSGSNKCALNRSGDYLYITASDANGDGVGAYRFNMTDWGIVYRPWTNGAWGNWETHIWNSAASRTANTVLAAPNGSAGAATFRALVPNDVPWIGQRTTVVSTGVDKGISTGTWTNLGSFSVVAGRSYLVTCQTAWNAASSGSLAHGVSSSVAAPNEQSSSYVTNACNGAAQRLSSTCTLNPTANATYYFVCYQSSGSSLTLRGHSCYVMRIA